MNKPISEAMVRRLNNIMYAIQLKPMTIKELYAEIALGRRSMLTHVRKLIEAGKIIPVESPSDRRNKVYRVAQGAMPFKFESPILPGQEPKKRGPKLGTKYPEREDISKIKIIPAKQIGMQRDPLIAALFGMQPRTSA